MDEKELTIEEKKKLYIIRKRRKLKNAKNIYLTGEDIDMLIENNDARKENNNICDQHEDGA